MIDLDLKWLKAEPWATSYGGTFAFNTPMVYALGFVFLFTVGGFYSLAHLKGYYLLKNIVKLHYNYDN